MSDIENLADQQIYLGSWTNWSQGRILGATITLNRNNGNLLIAFLALFVSYTGTCLWRIIGFGFHRHFSTAERQDGLYHQRQAILRNSDNANAALWDLTYLAWIWRRKSRSLRRLSPLLASAVISLIAFAVASLFSSRITGLTGSEVLISSPSCGLPWTGSMSTSDRLSIMHPYTAQMMNSAMSYAQRCYSKNAKMENCDYFVRPRLDSTIIRNASCPFQEHMCLLKNGNIILDTGLVDSHRDLGFNSPISKRTQFRRVDQCAPLIMDNFTDTYVYQGDDRQITYRRYNYGPRLHWKGVNYTHIQPDLPIDQLRMQSFKTTLGDYRLSFLQAYSFKGSLIPQVSEIKPMEALHRGDADVSLIFLAAGDMTFTQPVDDPWYSAHQPLMNVSQSGQDKGLLQLYSADSPASVLGCTTQYQQCVPSLPEGQRCTPLGGIWELNQTFPAATDWQNNMTQLVSTPFGMVEFQQVVTVLQAASLTSRYSSQASIQGSLPNNQWQLDLEQWHHTSLAAVQNSVVEFAIGPTTKDPIRRQWMLPENDVEKYVCKNQKIKSSQYLNFSILGLSITLCIGSLIIVMNYALPSLVRRIRGRKPGSLYAGLEWCSTGTLQLQRMAHEGLGYGTWYKCDEEIPMVDSDDYLAVLDISNPKHPKLKLEVIQEKDLSVLLDVKQSSNSVQDSPEIFMGGNAHDTNMPSRFSTETQKGGRETLHLETVN